MQNPRRLEDLQFFQNVLARDPKKGKMAIKLCRLLNKLVPNTLSHQIFHDMNCLEMYKKYPNGKYWSKATFYVVTNTPIYQFIWDELQKEPDGLQEITHPLLSKDLCDKFKHVIQVSIEDCKLIACGYNTWSLQQVHINPSVMYLWWFSSSYYLLQLEAYLADFYHLKFPQYLQKTVQVAISVVEKARFYLNLGLQCLLLTVRNGVNFKKKHYEEIISAVSLVISYNFETAPRMLNSIACLKRMCWSESSAREVTISPGLKKRRDLGEHLEPPCKHEFVLPLWDYFPCSIFMREQLVACIGCSECKAKIQTQKLKDFENVRKMYPDVTLENLKVFISQVFMKQERFKAEDEEALLRVADDSEIWMQVYMLQRNIDFLRVKIPLGESDRGPFYVVLIFTVYHEQANLLAAMTQRLSTLSGLKPLAVHSEGPDMSLEEIEKVFKDIELVPQWTFENSLKKSQGSVAATEEICKSLDRSQNCIELLTSRFEFQIKRMVLRIVQRMHCSLESELADNFLIDMVYSMRFIQYLLPCFVASYFELKEDKRVSLEARNFYLNFIKQLLQIWDEGDHSGFYFKENTVCFLKWKFETVWTDLEGKLYSELEVPDKNYLTAEEQPPLITRTMQSNCFDVLTDFLGMTKEKTYFDTWRKELYKFSNSLQISLFKLTQMPPGFSTTWRAELKAMSVLSRILASEVFKRYSFEDKIEYNHTNLLLGAIFKAYAKSEKLMMIRMMPGATKKNTWNDFQKRVEAESAKLSEQQRLALALYIFLSSSGANNFKACENYNERIVLACDAVEKAYYQIKSGKFLRFQQKLSNWQRDNEGVNLAQVSYKYAMEVAPLCYSVVTCRLTKDMKIQMKEPGEITFCPVRHCRWCGQVETEQKELFVCQFCKDIPEYPDVNLFCSLDCEEKTLDKKHREEHAEVIEMQLGIRDAEHCEENIGISSNRLEKLEPNYIENDNDLVQIESNLVYCNEKDANLELPEANVVADFTKKDKELPETESDASLKDVVGSQGCAKCLNKEPKEEMYLVCRGSCNSKFHLQCTDILDSEGILRIDFLPALWTCGRCSVPPSDAVKKLMQNTKTAKSLRDLEKILKKISLDE